MGKKASEGDLASLVELRRRRDVILGSNRTVDSQEEDSFNANQQALVEAQEKFLDGITSGEEFDELIENGASFEDVLASLDDETRKYLQRYIGYNDLEKRVNDKRVAYENKWLAELSAIASERLALELELGEATRTRLSREYEAREIIARNGGAEFTPGQRIANRVAQLNAGAATSGISDLQDASPAALRKRANEIGEALAQVNEDIRGAREAGDEAGIASLEKRQKELTRLADEQYEQTKEIIAEREKELKLLKAKNQQEQQGLEAAIAGDFDKFFQLQAQQGATAAIASGNANLAAAFGQSAIAGAFGNLQNLQSQGVNSLFGQSIAGEGGLLQRTGAAGLAGVGITDPRAVGVLSGTTPEQAALQREIQGLAGTLPATASKQEAQQINS